MVLFGTSICISHLASADQINRKPRLICNSSEDPDNVTPSVSVFIDKALAPKAMQFGVCLFRLFLKNGNLTLRMASSGYPNGISCTRYTDSACA